MKTYISLICVLLLAGCGETMTPVNYAKAVEVCKVNDGVKELDVGPINFDISCNNGAEFGPFRKF